MPQTEDPPYITTTQELAELTSRLAEGELVAVDTEFIRERTYWARLCLIQIGDGQTSALIDPFEVEDLSPLFDLLLDPGVVKVLHAGDQDLEIFHKLMGDVPRPVFDTQVAAALASFPLQAGYGLLVSELLGVDLDKVASFTDWARRPLSKNQLTYALNDVVYLPEVYRRIRDRLETDGRLDWLEADFTEMSDPATYEVVPEEMYKRVKRRNRLRRREMGVLLHLAAWREYEAMRRDVPRNRIVGDETLIQLASRKPSRKEELQGVRGLNEKVARRCANDILSAVKAGLAIPDDELPSMPRRSGPRMDTDTITDMMSALVRLRAREFGIAVPVLASRKEMELLARGEREDCRLLSGWRRSHIGDELVDLVEGRISLSLDGERIRVERRDA